MASGWATPLAFAQHVRVPPRWRLTLARARLSAVIALPDHRLRPTSIILVLSIGRAPTVTTLNSNRVIESCHVTMRRRAVLSIADGVPSQCTYSFSIDGKSLPSAYSNSIVPTRPAESVRMRMRSAPPNVPGFNWKTWLAISSASPMATNGSPKAMVSVGDRWMYRNREPGCWARANPCAEARARPTIARMCLNKMPGRC